MKKIDLFLMNNLKHVIICMWIMTVAVSYMNGISIAFLIPVICAAIATYFGGKFYYFKNIQNNVLARYAINRVCEEFIKFKGLDINTKIDINQINDNVLYINEHDKNEIYYVAFTNIVDRKTLICFIDVNDNNIKETLNKLKNKDD